MSDRLCVYCGDEIPWEKRADTRFCSAKCKKELWYEESKGNGYVYFIQAATGGPIKIGRATNPEDRLAGVQTGNPNPLRITNLLVGGFELERELHRTFKRFRLSGEWFAPMGKLPEIAKAKAADDVHPDLYLALRKAHERGYEEGHQDGRKAREDADLWKVRRAHTAALEAAEELMKDRPDLRRFAGDNGGIEALFPLVDYHQSKQGNGSDR